MVNTRGRRRRRWFIVVSPIPAFALKCGVSFHLPPALPFVHHTARISRRAVISGTRQLTGPMCPRLSFHKHAREGRNTGAQGSRVPKCAATALAYSADNVLCEGNEYHDFRTSLRPPTAVYVNKGSSGSKSMQQGSEEERKELATSSVAGDIVLLDWLDELPDSSTSRSPSVEEGADVELVLTSSSRGKALQAGDGRKSEAGGSGVENDAGDDDSVPLRFQQLIQRMWAELNRNDQLAYLDAAGQARVKGALTVLAAYGALREHPFHDDVSSPQQAFSEMDLNRDGEVSFDEFVRWYSMSTALQQTEEQQQHHRLTATADERAVHQDDHTTTQHTDTAASTGTTTPAAPVGTAMSSAEQVPTTFATRPRKSAEGASRLLADLEGLALTKRPRGQPGRGGRGSTDRAAARSPSRFPISNDTKPTSPMPKSNHKAAPQKRAQPPPRQRASANRGNGWPLVFAPTTASSWAVEDTSGRRVATDAEKDAFRERWLAGGAVGSDGGGIEEGPVVGIGEGIGEASDAEEDLEKALELLTLLVKASADADTLIAALASRMIRNPTGRYNLEVIEEQFGPIIKGIVQDRLLLERLPEPTSAASYLAIRQSRGVKAVLDLDDHHAKLMREYLVHASKDARAVVVHMADLTCRLREKSKTPEYARQSLALEALQLYVPVSNALGLGSSFRELEELGYKALFPQSYATIGLWHRDVRRQSRSIVLEVKRRMLDALSNRPDLANRVHRYRIDGRTKGLVSTFRKVFRQNKRATEVHDIIGLRIIVEPCDDADPLPPVTGDTGEVSPAERRASFISPPSTKTTTTSTTTTTQVVEVAAGASDAVTGDTRTRSHGGDNACVVPALVSATSTTTTTIKETTIEQAVEVVVPPTGASTAGAKQTIAGKAELDSSSDVGEGCHQRDGRDALFGEVPGEPHVEHVFAVETQHDVRTDIDCAADVEVSSLASEATQPGANAAPTSNTDKSGDDDSSDEKPKLKALSEANAGWASDHNKTDARRKKRSKAELSVYTLQSFPPPYRDPDSRLLHDVYEVLVGLFEEVPGRYKNYVDFPKQNGYRSVHTTVLHPTTLRMELQVRTAKMHNEAEGGAAAHSLYKGDLNNPDEASLFRSKMTPPGSPIRAIQPPKLLPSAMRVEQQRKVIPSVVSGNCDERGKGEETLLQKEEGAKEGLLNSEEP